MRAFSPFLCLGLGLLVSSACGRPESASPPLRPVQTHVVTAREAGSFQKFSASLQAVSRQVFSFKTGGYIEEFGHRTTAQGKQRILEPGDSVRKDEILVSLRRSDFDDQVAAAQGQLAQATATLERAEYDLTRAERLEEEKILTDAQFEAYRAGRDAARGAVKSATAALSQATQMREDSVGAAEFHGFVVQRFMEKGDLALPGAPVIALADLTLMKAVFGIPDTALPRVRLGDPISLRSAVLQRDFDSRVTSISPAADSLTRLFSVELTVGNGDLLLKPGMVVTAMLPESEAAAGGVAVPLAMVTSYSKEAGAFAVFTLEPDGDRLIAHERKVEVGDISGNFLEIPSGLRVGETIVAYGLAGLRDGDAVVAFR